MLETIKMNRSIVQLIGSVHSSVSSVDILGTVDPTHIFVEATRDTIGLLKRNPNHSPRLCDLPRVLKFSYANGLPVHAMDASGGDIAFRIFGGMKTSTKLQIWRYLFVRKVMSPLAHAAFTIAVNTPRSKLDSFVTRWSVSASVLEEARRLRIFESASDDNISELIGTRQDVNRFISSDAYDPKAYRELCIETGIDERLQSILIEYRNDYMCNQVRRVLRTLSQGSVCAVVVGKNHVEGMKRNLEKGLNYTPPSLAECSIEKSSFFDQVLLADLITS